jgi:hypothetical protein
VLPELNEDGYLPSGQHQCTWEEFFHRFGTNEHRLELLEGLERALRNLKHAGCQRVLIGGSFVSDKPYPGDYDAIWTRDGVDDSRLNDVFKNVEDMRYGARIQKALYLGEFHPYHEDFVNHFAYDRYGVAKGLVELNPQEVSD